MGNIFTVSVSGSEVNLFSIGCELSSRWVIISFIHGRILRVDRTACVQQKTGNYDDQSSLFHGIVLMCSVGNNEVIVEELFGFKGKIAICPMSQMAYDECNTGGG